MLTAVKLVDQWHAVERRLPSTWESVSLRLRTEQPDELGEAARILGPMNVGRPHPRAYGAFPRKLRLYVRERKVIDWPFAIRSMTSLPAAVFGLKDRGVIRQGAWADLVVITPDAVGDKATYVEPHQLSVGIDTIVINGQVARRDGTFSEEKAGRVLTIER